MNNYEISRDRAQTYFLGFDQEKLIRFWNLDADEQQLFVDFFGKRYCIDRKNGTVRKQETGEQAGYEEVLSIFDLLCHESAQKVVSGHFAPVNSLKGRPKAAGVGTDFHSKVAACFDQDPDVFCRVCEALGGTPTRMGDIGYQFPVFAELSVILKFYHADEDFPASVTLLWDENMLQFAFYETVFYIAGFLLESIRNEMKRAGSQ